MTGNTKIGVRGARGALAVLLLMLASAAIAGEGFDVSGDIMLASDCTFRGASQTMSAGALHGTLSVAHDSGWWGYVWASNVDYTASTDPDDGAKIEVDIVVGYSRPLANNTELGLSWSRYAFPGTVHGVNYDYDEWTASLTIDERHWLEIGYSVDVFATAQTGVHYVLGTGFDVPGGLWLDVSLGHYDLDRAYSASYSYGEMSLRGKLDAIDWSVSYVATSDSAKEIYNPSTVRPRVIAAIGVSF